MVWFLVILLSLALIAVTGVLLFTNLDARASLCPGANKDTPATEK